MNAGGPAGQLIDGRFELLEPLGGGGMGLVWRARDAMLHREVALKEVRPPDPGLLGDDPVAAHVMRERVLREARALARLHHPNVVTIYHIVDTPRMHPWLVMELVTGGSLHDRLNRGTLLPHEAAHIGRGVLAALRAAHAAGIHHRDVKPANVLLRPDGTPVLTDFGIAGLRESTATNLTATGALIGSPEYIAPERIRGEEGNPASDLWSLGMLMYVAVEGFNPLRRDSTLATIAAVLDAPIPQPQRCGALEPVLAVLLTRDPAARPDAARLDQMLAAVLNAPLSSTPVPNMPPPGTPLSNAAFNFAAPGPSAPALSNSLQSSIPTPLPTPPPSYAPYGPTDSIPNSRTAPTGQTPWPQLQPQPQSSRPPRPRRNAIFVSAVVGTALLGLTAALIWSLHGSAPGATSGGTPSASALASSGTHSSTTAATSAPAAPAAQNQSFLTPAGARGMVSTLGQHFGTTKIISMTIYPDGVSSIEVPIKAGSKLYNSFDYRGGAFSQDPISGTMADDDGIVDLNTFNWNALPTLLSYADKHLNVAHPTAHYVIVYGNDPFRSGPALLVYVTDAYGAGYLTADTKGHVVGTIPAER